MLALQPFCVSDGTVYNVGDEWRPSRRYSVCKCVGPSLTECSLMMVCFDHHQNQREPGDRWLSNPTTSCTCTDSNFVICELLQEPACMDISGNLRNNNETWMNSSCVGCSCVNGNINCTRYDVKITYGLYSVKMSPTCENCDIPSNVELGDSHSCEGKEQFYPVLPTSQCILIT